jgi:hypothetical protein
VRDAPFGGRLLRITTGGQACALPFALPNGTRADDCAELDGRSVCRVATGELGECLPMVTVAPTSTSCLPASTVSAAAAAKLFDYCGVLGGPAYCRIAGSAPPGGGADAAGGVGGAWLECPGPPRATLDGDDCTFPFQMGGHNYTTCAAASLGGASLSAGGSGPGASVRRRHARPSDGPRARHALSLSL